jgi:large subunit ribosomal protein L15
LATLNEILEHTKKHKHRRRVGRGRGSGLGKTCGRGTKGWKSRSGSGGRPLNEGGQMPLFRRIPKRGFNNKWRVQFSVVNVGQLNCFGDGEEITPARLAEAGLIRDAEAGIKVLGNGALKRSLTISAHKFSRSAAEKIQAAGGAALQIGK